MQLRFFVHGRPVAQGSKKHVGGGRMVEMGKGLDAWRNDVRYAAMQQMSGVSPSPDPIEIYLHFYYDRPKGHFGTGRNAHLVKASAPRFHVKTPDLDKLCRAVLDAITDVVFCDDSQVRSLTANRSYTSTPGNGFYGVGQGVLIEVQDREP